MNYFFIDAETDGLYGNVIAVGVVVKDKNGKIIEEFAGKLDMKSNILTDGWCRENVYPVLYEQENDMMRYESESTLLEEVWGLWLKYRESSYAVADVAYPVETGLFRKCVLQDEENRKFLAPYPLLDLSTLLLARGVDPQAKRTELLEEVSFIEHHPLHDAMMTATLWNKYYE